jgi:RNA polymerase-binding transcription factor DksA
MARITLTVDDSFLRAFAQAVERQRAVEDEPEAYEAASEIADAAARELGMAALEAAQAQDDVVEQPEYCDECGSEIPAEADSVAGSWHKDTCSAYEARRG